MDVIKRHSEPFSETELKISEAGKLLSHPARIRVLNLILEHGSMTTSEMAGLVPLARTTVLQHIAALKEGGWLNTTTDGSSIKYHINSSALAPISQMLESIFNDCCERRSTEDDTKLTKILFLCTGNSARSQMAEGFINSFTDNHNVKAVSAGTRPAKEVNPLAIEVMAERNIDISSQQPKTAKEFIGDKTIDLVIIVCDQAERECPYLFPHSKHRISMPFKDPKTPEEFRKVRDQIEKRLNHLMEELQE
ncbi:MAG: helix-turn-helix domain-containing protein [Spirochaetales bacterium]|uniref:Helix-turn-helix domain-containing protein n=1 Tax=Candidatus Thalassospirochaeta sargassi TaxID=3119039 RepID=A0AAJ1ICY9_9SPIO|nr:helix-turn-helix domain-containing protein [Spirochaetales bacterium]